MKSRNIYFPNTNELNEARKKLRPVISSTPDGKGVCVNYVDLVTQTIEAQIKAAGLDCVLPNDKIEVMLKNQ